MKNLNKLIIVFFVLLSVVVAVRADPLTVDVIPIDDQVQPGGTAMYKVNLSNNGTVKETLTNLYASDGPSDFTYMFSSVSGDVLPGQTKQVDLSVTVPTNKPQGQYTFDVNADWQKKLGPTTIKKTANYLDVFLNVQIPEFPTIALPIISVIGLLFVMRRPR